MTIDRTRLSDSQNKAFDEIDKISPTFCPAKWHMVTMHLAQGETHSCYHPWTHKIPLEEIAVNPGALHNTEYKKSQRKLMLQGERPTECQYCWNMEDLGQISDRIIRSDEDWSRDDLGIFADYTGEENVHPRYVEVSFCATCNLKCSYCNPTVSTAWLAETRKFGMYKTSTLFNKHGEKTEPLPYIPTHEHNPFIEAFWKYLPDMYPHLRGLRITGGEPLLSKHTFSLLEYIATHDNKKLEVIVNSNMCVPDKIFDNTIKILNKITNKGGVDKITMFTSIDATGEQAEYGRNGLSWRQFEDNCYKFLDSVPNARLGFTCSFNIFSVPDIPNLITWLHKLRLLYGKRISFDTPYLRYPPHQCIMILPNEYVSYLREAEEYMLSNNDFFTELEINKIRRLQSYLTNKPGASTEEIDRWRKDFIIFVDEHDLRRKTNFVKAFPQYKQLYYQWKQQ